MDFRAIRFRAGMVYGSTTLAPIVTRSCHFITAGVRHTVRITPRSTIRQLTIQDPMVTGHSQAAMPVMVVVIVILRAVLVRAEDTLIRPVVVVVDPVHGRRSQTRS